MNNSDDVLVKSQQQVAEKTDVLDNYFKRLLADDLSQASLLVEEWPQEQPVQKKTAVDLLSLPFQAIHFQLHDIEMALPLHTIKAIVKTNSLTRAMNSAPYIIGMCHHQGKNTQVVDLQSWMRGMSSAFALTATTHSILLNDKWGISIEKSPDLTSLAPEKIKWRELTRSNQWLLGTVLESKCSLIHGEALAAAIEAFSA